MGQAVSVPLWLFLVLAALSGWAALVLLLVPGMRWYFRGRVNRVIAQINRRLPVALPSFKLTRRRVLIDRLFHDARVQAAAAAHARDSGEPLAETWTRVDRYAREIVPSFNAYVYFRIGYALARSAARLMYRVRAGYLDEAALARVAPESSIVFVMNHRSNMDYVLVAFLAAERVALSYAVGEWARVWPLQQLIKAMGAFFVRRNSGDPLYRVVLARYVAMATEAGVPQAMFPEGGLTLDGALRAPKFGLLDYMLKGFDEREGEGRRDLVFIPVGLNYDRVLEDRSQLGKLHPDRPRTGRLRALATTLSFMGRNLWQMVTGEWHRFGYACVNFGSPVSMRALARTHGWTFHDMDEATRRAVVPDVARRLMDAIGGVIPVLPVSLVASLMVEAPARAWSELELKAAALARMVEFEAAGAHTYIPRQDQDYAFGVGLRMLLLRRLVEERDGLYRPVPDDLEVLAYYAKAITHLARAGPAPMPAS